MDVFDLSARISLDGSEYTNALDKASEKTSTFGSKVKSGFATAGKVAAAGLAAASAAIVGFGKKSVDAGMQFDSAMAQVAATMGKSMDEFNSMTASTTIGTEKFTGTLREFAQYMGSTTAFSASQAADALNYMALAGYDAQTSMDVLPSVLNLAASGGIDLAYASDMVTDALSALGKDSDYASVMVDQLAMASSKSNTSVAQLGEAFLTVGGTAKTLKGGTTELSTALGILADNGVKGAEGGTALRNIILALSAPTDKAAKQMKALGLDVYDADGNLRGINEIFNDLNDSLSKMTQGQQTQVLNELFNKVDLKSVNALLANSNERFDELSTYIDNAGGSAEKMANTQLDNLAGDVTLFKSALEGAQIAISDKLTPTLRSFVQIGSDGLSKVAQAFTEGGLDQAMDAFGDFLSNILDKIIEVLPTVANAGGKVLTSLIKGISDNIDKLADAAVSIIDILMNVIIDNFPVIADGLWRLANKIVEKLPSIIKPILKKLPDIIKMMVKTFTSNLPIFINGLVELVVAIAQELPSIITAIIDELPTIIQMVVNGLMDSLPALIGGLVLLMTELAKHLPEIISGLLAALPEVISTILGALLPLSDGMQDMLKDVFSVIGPVIEEVTSIVSDFFSGIALFLTDPKEAISKFFDWFENKANKVVNSVKDIFVGLFELIKSTIDEMESADRLQKAKTEEEKLIVQGLRAPVEGSTYSEGVVEAYNAAIAKKQEATVEHTGTIRIEGVNNQGEMIGAADYVVDQMRKESRLGY